MSSRSDREVLAFYGHHRCGSSWISALLEAACSKLGLRFRQVYDHRMFGDDLPGFVARESVDVLVYMNADWTHAKTLKQQRAFHVIRDPRDVLVSAYYSHRYSHPTDYWTELIEHRDVLEGLTLVVSPLIALMKDQVDSLLARDIAAARLPNHKNRKSRLASELNMRDDPRGAVLGRI